MNDYVTDEQRVESIRKWWSENGAVLIGGLALGLAVLFGWHQWQAHKRNVSVQASDLFAELVVAVEKQSTEEMNGLADKLKSDFAGTPYASLGQMAVARYYLEKDDLASAQASLEVALELAKQDELRELAQLRLSRVLIASGQLDEAMKLLEGSWPAPYTAMLEELKGDVYVAKGDVAAAISAYDRALLVSGGRSEFLQMKRDSLGPAAEEASS